MAAESVPRREVVTARPHTPGAGRTPPPSAPAPAPGAARPDGAAVGSLMRRQLRAALTATALLAAPLGLLPVLLRLLPPSPRVPPVPWLLLGVAPYPALLGIGVWYVRRAERNERGAPAPPPARAERT